jgi:hypothetical protein
VHIRHAATALLLLTSCEAEPPVTHSVRVESRCGPCGEPASTTTEGTVFTQDDGQLALFTDFGVAPQRTAMLEIAGIDGAAPAVRYHEIEGGQVAFVGEVDAASITVRRLSEGARISGTIALEVHDADSGETRSFPNIRVHPADAGGVVTEGPGSSSGAGRSGGSRGGGTSVVVVVQPAPRTYVSNGGGCEGDTSSSSGGCEGDTSSSGGGCEGDTSSSGGGCEGDTSSSGCEGDTAGSSGCDSGSSSGCEAGGRAAFPGLFRLLWPIFSVGAWNRVLRRRRDHDD